MSVAHAQQHHLGMKLHLVVCTYRVRHVADERSFRQQLQRRCVRDSCKGSMWRIIMRDRFRRAFAHIEHSWVQMVQPKLQRPVSDRAELDLP